MKKIASLLVAALLAVMTVPAKADLTFSQFITGIPAATVPLGTGDLVPVVQGGVSKSVAPQSLGILNPVAGGLASTINALPCWNNTLGTSIKPCGVIALPLSIGTPPTQWPPLNNYTSAGMFNIDTTKQTSPAITYIANASGTVPNVTSDTAGMPLYWLYQKGALTGGGVNINKSIGIFEADYNDTGTGSNDDSFTGVSGNCNIWNARPNRGIAGGALSAACVAGQFGARIFSSQGGSLASNQPQGEVHGVNVVSGFQIIPGITSGTPGNMVDNEGIEVDMVGCVGCTMLARVGVYSVDFGDGVGGGAEQGSSIDAAFAIASVPGTAGWQYGIDFLGPPMPSTGYALAGDGTVLGTSSTRAYPAVIAKNGIDLSNFQFTDYAFLSPHGNFYVTGAGNVQAPFIKVYQGMTVDTPHTSDATIPYADNGAAFWSVGRQATTDDFIIKNPVSGTVSFRINASTGDMTINNVTIPINASMLASSVTANATGFISDAIHANNASISFRDNGTAIWEVAREALTQDFIIKNGATVDFRSTVAGLISIGSANGITISSTGSLKVQGVQTTGTVAGSVCMLSDKTLIYKAGVNCF